MALSRRRSGSRRSADRRHRRISLSRAAEILGLDLRKLRDLNQILGVGGGRDASLALVADASVLIDIADANEAVLALVAQHVSRVIVPTPVLAEVDTLDELKCAALGLEVVEPYAVDVVRVVALGNLAFGLVQLGSWYVMDRRAIQLVAGASLLLAAGFAILAATQGTGSSDPFHQLGSAVAIGWGVVAVLYAVLLYRERTAGT